MRETIFGFNGYFFLLSGMIDGDVYQGDVSLGCRLGSIRINKNDKTWYGTCSDGIGMGWANYFFTCLGLNIDEYELDVKCKAMPK